MTQNIDIRALQYISAVVDFPAQYIDVAREYLQGARVSLQRWECDPEWHSRVDLAI